MQHKIVYGIGAAFSVTLVVLSARSATASHGQGTAIVRLQSSTPGVVQTGHLNVSGTIKGGVFSGGGSGLTGIPLSALQQGGAIANNVLKWNGSAWAPGTDDTGSGGLSSVIHDSTLIGLGTSGSPLGVAVPLILTGSLGSPGGIIDGRNSGGGYGVKGTYTTNGGFGALGSSLAGVYGTGPNYGVFGDVSAADTIGVRGISSASTGAGKGVYGRSDATSGVGVYGWASSPSGANAGVYGFSTSPSGFGVYGLHGSDPATLLPTAAVGGESVARNGVAGISDLVDGVFGKTQKTGTFALGSGSLIGGVHGYAADSTTLDNFGVVGSGSGYACGVLGVGSGRGHGVIGIPGSQNETHTAVGVLGLTNEGGWPPLSGLNETTDKSQVAILGQSNSRVAVWGESLAKIGILGTVGSTFTAAGLAGDLAGVMGRSSLSTSSGVLGIATGASDAGVRGKFGGNTGILGSPGAGVVGSGLVGVQATCTGGPAALMATHVLGFTATLAGSAASFTGSAPGGVTSATLADGSAGVSAYASGSRYAASLQHSNSTYAVICGQDAGMILNTPTVLGAQVISNGVDGVAGYFQAGGSGNTIGIQAIGATAGSFGGDVGVSGTLTAASKFFRIDHPLDPANKYLNHACVESDQMRNMYAGRAVMDEKGEAWIELPSYFDAVNGEPEYHLTAIGAAAPDLHIAEEVKGNHFKIAGGKPGLKVSWQVYGVRTDPYAVAHPLVVEQAKPDRDKGRYQNPELYGQPASLGIVRVRGKRG